MIKNLGFFILLFFSGMSSSYSASECLDFLDAPSADGLVKIYAGPGVIIPDAFECVWCGTPSIMPANLRDPRVTILNSSSDIQNLREQSGGKSPEFAGATVRCTNCPGHSPIWQLGRPGQPPKLVLKTTELPIHMDPVLKKRYVVLPEKYKELADPNSKMNDLVEAQLLAVCPNCGVNGMLNSKPEGRVKCSGCGNTVSPDNIFDLRRILDGSNPDVQRSGNVAAPKDNSSAKTARQTPSPAQVQQGRSALSRFANKWVASGVTALAILAGSSAYYLNNTPLIAEGVVVSVSQQMAHVQFQEAPYFSNDSRLKTYDVAVMLGQRNTLPGEESNPIEKGDRVTVHYTWSDFHVLPFIFHPYSAAEFYDGSYVDSNGVQSR